MVGGLKNQQVWFTEGAQSNGTNVPPSCSTLSFFILHGEKIILETGQEKELGQAFDHNNKTQNLNRQLKLGKKSNL